MERKERQESHTPLAKEEGDSRGRDTEERKQDLRGIPTYPLHFQGMCEHTCTYTQEQRHLGDTPTMSKYTRQGRQR